MTKPKKAKPSAACRHCKKPRGEHEAGTLRCPYGRGFSMVRDFGPLSKPKKPKPKPNPAACTLGVPGCTGHYDSNGRPVKSWR